MSDKVNHIQNIASQHGISPDMVQLVLDSYVNYTNTENTNFIELANSMLGQGWNFMQGLGLTKEYNLTRADFEAEVEGDGGEG
jgi:hypothetical protein